MFSPCKVSSISGDSFPLRVTKVQGTFPVERSGGLDLAGACPPRARPNHVHSEARLTHPGATRQLARALQHTVMGKSKKQREVLN